MTWAISEKEIGAIILIGGMILGGLIGCLFGVLQGIQSERKKNKLISNSKKDVGTGELTGKLTITDSKNNKTIIDGTMEGFIIKKYPSGGGGAFSEHSLYLDSTWKGKQVLCVLLEKPDLDK